MKKLVPFLLLLIMFAAAAWYSFIKKPDPVHELLPDHTPPAMPVETQQPESQPAGVVAHLEPKPSEVPEPLLPLEDSDPGFTNALVEMMGAEAVDIFLVQDQVISRTVAMIDSLDSRQVPAQINPVKPADDKFIVETQGDQIVMSTQNFARYDAYVDLIQKVDTQALMKVYRRHYPLFQQAWIQNGGEGSFSKRFIGIIDHLLETPDIPGPVYLTRSEAVYVFAEPGLEAMTAGQKILIRMGSVNASVVKEKLSEMRAFMNP